MEERLRDLERERDRLLCRRVPLGTASPTAFAQKALTELRPLGLGSSELGELFRGGGSGGGELAKVATFRLHIMLLLGGLWGLKAVEGSRGLKVVDSFALFFGMAF